ncbi:ThiF family adenylyltransferase [Vreelandella sp. EE22]
MLDQQCKRAVMSVTGNIRTVEELRLEALRELHRFLSELGGYTLPAEIISGFARRQYTHGWQLKLGDGPNHKIKVMADSHFPFDPISVFADPSLYRFIPHVERDGFVCTLPGQATIDTGQTTAVARDVLQRAYRILATTSSSMRVRNDFVTEFLSYWEGTINGRTVLSLLTPGGEVRTIVVWRGERFILIAEDEKAATRWLRFSYGDSKLIRAQRFKFENGLYIPLSAPPTPKNYPLTPDKALRLADVEGEAKGKAIRKAIDGHIASFLVMFSGHTTNGPAFFAIDVRVPKPENRGPYIAPVDRLIRGFRFKKIEEPLPAKSIRPRRSIECRRVRRIDPSWVHGRDAITSIPHLREPHVVLIGCGSLGSSVATQIAQCGVGQITLVDPDLMVAANAGRHGLGLDALYRNKASALREHLLARFPHSIAIERHEKRWEDVTWAGGNVFAEADVVVSSIGDWRTEEALNMEWISSGRSSLFIAGWTEPFAGAGHAVILDQQSGCLACHLSAFGVPDFRVTQWPELGTVRQEPACAAMFQPYGPIELGHIQSLVSQAVVDAITGSVTDEQRHRIWCGQKRLVSANGGVWTNRWASAYPGRDEGGFLTARTWEPNRRCKHCGSTI